MSERYTRLFALTENLYAEGSPVVIGAGALVKDNQTGRVLAQLKFQSISPKKIKALKVKITPLDTVSQPLGEAIEYQYLDLAALRGREFGQKSPIPLPDAAARAFLAEVREVAYEDNTVWQSGGEPWEPLKRPASLYSAIYDNELQKQVRLEYGDAFNVMPDEDRDLWFCSCGALNRKGEPFCYRCHQKLADLLAMDMEALKDKRDARLSEEAAQAAQARAAAEAKAKKTKKLAAIITPIVAAVIVASVLISGAQKKKAAYNEALGMIANGDYRRAAAMLADAGFKDAEDLAYGSLYEKAAGMMEAGDYTGALEIFAWLGDYSDSAEHAEKAAAQIKDAEEKAELLRLQGVYEEAEELLAQGETAQAAMAFGSICDYQNARERCFALWNEIARNTIAAGGYHTVGLNADGTVVAIGYNDDGRCDVSGWKDIVAVSAGPYHTVGLKADGTVVATGSNKYGPCDVSGWNNIVAVSAGEDHTVGLKADGTVVAVGSNKHGRCDVSGWKDIVAVSAGSYHTVGLKADGTVVAVGSNDNDRCDVSGWEDIVAVSAGSAHTVGLKADGTVVAIGSNKYGQCDVSSWEDIVAVSCGGWHTVGLKADGTVVAVGENKTGHCDVSGWEDIVVVSAGWFHTVGLKADGTVVTVGFNEDGRCDVSGWTNIKLPGTK